MSKLRTPVPQKKKISMEPYIDKDLLNIYEPEYMASKTIGYR